MIIKVSFATTCVSDISSCSGPSTCIPGERREIQSENSPETSRFTPAKTAQEEEEEEVSFLMKIFVDKVGIGVPHLLDLGISLNACFVSRTFWSGEALAVRLSLWKLPGNPLMRFLLF